MAQAPAKQSRLTNKQKAALLLLSLDVETAAKLMQQLTQQEIEDITLVITNVKGIPLDSIDNVVEEFQRLIAAQKYVVQGGLEQAQNILEKSVGVSKARVIVEKIKTHSRGIGFDALRRSDAHQLANFLLKEHPQTVALILSNLNTEQTAQVLVQFPEDLQRDVAYRMATLGKVSPALLTEVESALESIALSEVSSGMSVIGGTRSVANILNKVDTGHAKTILEHIEEREPQVASEIKRLMFMFEDIVTIDDRGIQRMLREVDKKDLGLSLKVADEKLKQKIFANMSERARELLQEELQYMGPVRLREVEAAQARVVAIVKQLEDQGEIIIAGRGGVEEVLV